MNFVTANGIGHKKNPAKLVSKYIEFFISENELNKFKKDPNHKIYCLIKSGRSYKLHEVNKYDLFRNNYLSPMILEEELDSYDLPLLGWKPRE